MPLILGTNSIKETGFDVANSCRFEASSSDYMHKTPSSAGNRQKWTFSFWTKVAGNFNYYAFSSGTAATDRTYIYFNDSALGVQNRIDSSNVLNLITNAFHRDVAAWYNFVVAIDTTQGTAANRAKCYINGTQITSFETEAYPDQNVNTFVNNTQLHTVGKPSWTDSAYYSGYMAEAVFIDGQQLAPTSFGEFDSDSGIWKPINVSGLTAGTNGFYLDFEDSSNLGNDAFGGTDLTEVNLTAIDQSTDTCTNNFATMNPLDNYPISTPGTFSEGNLQIVSGQGSSSSNGYSHFTGTFGLTAGKWYWEAKCTDTGAASLIGIVDKPADAANSSLNSYTYGYSYRHSDGDIYNNGSGADYGNSYGTSDIIGIALDLDNNKLYFSKNGTFQNSGDPTSGATGTGAKSITAAASTNTGFYFPVVGDTDYSDTSTWQLNFGGGSPISVSSGNTDGDGFGNFEFAVPSGYFSLCTKNLSEYG